MAWAVFLRLSATSSASYCAVLGLCMYGHLWTAFVHGCEPFNEAVASSSADIIAAHCGDSSQLALQGLSLPWLAFLC